MPETIPIPGHRTRAKYEEIIKADFNVFLEDAKNDIEEEVNAKIEEIVGANNIENDVTQAHALKEQIESLRDEYNLIRTRVSRTLECTGSDIDDALKFAAEQELANTGIKARLNDRMKMYVGKVWKAQTLREILDIVNTVTAG